MFFDNNTSAAGFVFQDSGLTEDEVIALIKSGQINAEQLEGLLAQISVKQGESDAVFKAKLEVLQTELNKVQGLQAEKTKNSSTAQATATATAEQAKALEELNAKLQKGLAERDANREVSRDDAFVQTGILAKDGGLGERAKRALSTLVNQNDIVNNGTRAGTRLATDSSFFGALTRNVVGNPFFAGAKEVEDASSVLRSNTTGLKTTADGLFETSLNSLTPVSELTTAFNAGNTTATALAKATEARLSVDPLNNKAEAESLGITANNLQTQKNTAKSIFAVDTKANDRSRADAILTTSNRIAGDRGVINTGIAVGNAFTNNLPVDSNGEVINEANANFLDRNNRRTVNQNQATRSSLQLGVDRATGKLDANVQKGVAESQRKATKASNDLTVYKAQLSGLDKDGNFKQEIVDNAVKSLTKDYETKVIQAKVDQLNAQNDLENAALNNDSKSKKSRITNKQLTAEERQQAQSIAQDQVRLDLLDKELEIKSAELAVTEEFKNTWTETQRLKYQADAEKYRDIMDEYNNTEYRMNTKLTKFYSAKSQASEARILAEISKDPVTQIQRISTAKLSYAKELNDIKLNTSDVANRANLINLNNRLDKTILESQQNKTRLEVTSTVGFKQLSKEAQIAELRILEAKQTKELAQLTQANRNRSTVEDLTDKQLQAEVLEAESKLAILSNEELQSKQVLEAVSRQEANIAISQNTVKGIQDTNVTNARRSDSYTKLTGEILPEGVQLAKEVASIIDIYSDTGKLGSDPLVAARNLNAIISTEKQTPILQQTLTELQATAKAVGITEVGKNTTAVNAVVNKSINGRGVKDLDDSNLQNNLNRVPNKSLIVPVMKNPEYAGAVDSVANWDKASPLEKLQGLRQYYESKSPNEPIEIIVGKIAETMKDVMLTKSEQGRFKQLGIPTIRELNYKIEVLPENSPRINNLINSLPFGIGTAKGVVGNKVDVDVMSTTSLMRLIRAGTL